MRVLLAGGSGLIGTALTERLRESGHEVRRLVRRPTNTPDEHRWDPPQGRIDAVALEQVDAVVNLCGAPLQGGRWSAARKQNLLDSRIEPTEVLAEAVAEQRIPVLVNASAVGYYGHTGDHQVDENSASGSDFLSGMCRDWEAATEPARRAGVRVVRIRTGLVLAAKGGLMDVLRPLFRFGLGGRLGKGDQYMPWISLTDELAAIQFALEHDSLSGPANLCAPNPVTNREFTRVLGRALRRPAPWWAPAPAMKLVLGQMAEEMALTGQRAVPHALSAAGFEFAHPRLDQALAALR